MQILLPADQSPPVSPTQSGSHMHVDAAPPVQMDQSEESQSAFSVQSLTVPPTQQFFPEHCLRIQIWWANEGRYFAGVVGKAHMQEGCVVHHALCALCCVLHTVGQHSRADVTVFRFDQFGMMTVVFCGMTSLVTAMLTESMSGKSCHQYSQKMHILRTTCLSTCPNHVPNCMPNCMNIQAFTCIH